MINTRAGGGKNIFCGFSHKMGMFGVYQYTRSPVRGSKLQQEAIVTLLSSGWKLTQLPLITV